MQSDVNSSQVYVLPLEQLCQATEGNHKSVQNSRLGLTFRLVKIYQGVNFYERHPTQPTSRGYWVKSVFLLCLRWALGSSGLRK